MIRIVCNDSGGVMGQPMQANPATDEDAEDDDDDAPNASDDDFMDVFGITGSGSDDEQPPKKRLRLKRDAGQIGTIPITKKKGGEQKHKLKLPLLALAWLCLCVLGLAWHHNRTKLIRS